LGMRSSRTCAASKSVEVVPMITIKSAAWQCLRARRLRKGHSHHALKHGVARMQTRGLHANRRGTVAQRVPQVGSGESARHFQKPLRPRLRGRCLSEIQTIRQEPPLAGIARTAWYNGLVSPGFGFNRVAALRISERSRMRGGDRQQRSRTRVVITRGSVDSLARKVAHVLRAAILAHLPSTRQTLADTHVLLLRLRGRDWPLYSEAARTHAHCSGRRLHPATGSGSGDRDR
jgi:hypothetical protein